MSQAAPNARERAAKAARRHSGKQLVGFIFLLMVLFTVVWSGWRVIEWMNDPERLPLSRLVITGERHYTTNDDIRHAIMSLGAPGTFVTQDVNIIQQQVERLPWIQQVSVRKQWPDELKIHLVEYVPAARWNDLQLINSTGETFSLPDERTGKLSLPLLYGPEGSGKEVLDGYKEINTVLSAANFKLKSVVMSARRSWQVTLENDVKVALGREERSERLQRFIHVYPLLEKQGQLANLRVNYIDLRYDTGVAVGWSPVFVDQVTGEQNPTPSSVTE